MGIEKIISGGQTGVDRAALDAALQAGIEIGGFCPKERKAEDGRIPDCYPLTETLSASYAERTRKNVAAADGTLILTIGLLEGGTAMTAEYARKLGKPYLIVQLDKQRMASCRAVRDWINENEIAVLNVAGPRESKSPGVVYKKAFAFMYRLLQKAAPRTGCRV